MTAAETGRAAALSRIRAALIEKKMTQAELADAADCHEKTVQNLLSGRTVRDQTLFDCCVVLGLDFDTTKALWQETALQPQAQALPPPDMPGEPSPPHAPGRPAPVYMGAYTRAAVEDLIGSYLTLRPAFTVADLIIAYRTEITWDDGWPSLLFEEQERPDAPFAHRGRLHVPAGSQFIHLVSLTKGAMRMITVSQLDQTGAMRGLVATLAKHRAAVTPVAAPILYLKLAFTPLHPLLASLAGSGGPAFGEIAAGHAAYAGYRQAIDQTLADGYVRLAGR